MLDEPRDGEYVIIEDFNACVKAFDALIAVAEATSKMLVDTPESYPSDRFAEKESVVLDDAINNAITLLQAGVKEARMFQ